jgi:hypothetical protein
MAASFVNPVLVLDLSASSAEEGFFKPDEIVRPFDKSRVLRSIVRIHTHVYWDGIVFASGALTPMESRCRNFLLKVEHHRGPFLVIPDGGAERFIGKGLQAP